MTSNSRVPSHLGIVGTDSRQTDAPSSGALSDRILFGFAHRVSPNPATGARPRVGLIVGLLVTAFAIAIPTAAAPLRVDINSEGRADMRTVGWENSST